MRGKKQMPCLMPIGGGGGTYLGHPAKGGFRRLDVPADDKGLVLNDGQVEGVAAHPPLLVYQVHLASTSIVSPYPLALASTINRLTRANERHPGV